MRRLIKTHFRKGSGPQMPVAAIIPPEAPEFKEAQKYLIYLEPMDPEYEFTTADLVNKAIHPIEFGRRCGHRPYTVTPEAVLAVLIDRVEQRIQQTEGEARDHLRQVGTRLHAALHFLLTAAQVEQEAEKVEA